MANSLYELETAKDAQLAVAYGADDYGLELLEIDADMPDEATFYSLLATQDYTHCLLGVAWNVASTCWNGLFYIMYSLSEPEVQLHNDIFKILGRGTVVQSGQELPILDDGIYYFEWTGFESHYFAIEIRNGQLLYAGSYGGYCLVTKIQFSTSNWWTLINNAMRGDIRDYALAFGLGAPELLPHRTSNFRELTYVRARLGDYSHNRPAPPGR